MTTAIELYLRDQIIRGELRNDSGRRAIDLLNESTSSVIELHDAWSGSLHIQALPARRGTVRVRRTEVLFAIPHDTARSGPRQLRSAYVEKRPLPAEVDLGPFFLSGTMHVGAYDKASIELSANDAGKVAFIAVTGAHVTSAYDASWSLDAGIVLVNRPAISYVCTPAAAAASPAHEEVDDRRAEVAEGDRAFANLQHRAAGRAPLRAWPVESHR